MRRLACLSILAGLALGLPGCQSNNAPATPTETQAVATSIASPAPKAIADTRPVLVCFGDSLTAGLGTDPGESYPDYLQADLDQRHLAYRVDNEGISGNTTKDGVERIPQILALHPAVVVVEFGGNDGLRGLRIEDTRANLDRILHDLRASGTAIVLAGITLPPDYGPDYIQQFNDTYVVLAKKYHVPMLPFLLKNVYGVPGLMQSDRTHATARGNRIVAQNVLPLVTPLLKK
jgi:acyl-CoA thioesterase-1